MADTKKEEKEEEKHFLFGRLPELNKEVDEFDNLGGLEANTKGPYKGWVEFDSFQWGVGCGISSPGGRGWRDDNDDDEEEEDEEEKKNSNDPNWYGERECSSASVSEVTVTKTFSSHTPMFFYKVVSQGLFDMITLEFTRFKDGKHTPYLRVLLAKVYVSGYSISYGSKEGLPSESLSFNFAGLEVIGLDGGKPTDAVSYNIANTIATLKRGPKLEEVQRYNADQANKAAEKIKKLKEEEKKKKKEEKKKSKEEETGNTDD